MSSCWRVAAHSPHVVAMEDREKLLWGFGCHHSWRHFKNTLCNSGIHCVVSRHPHFQNSEGLFTTKCSWRGWVLYNVRRLLVLFGTVRAFSISWYCQIYIILLLAKWPAACFVANVPFLCCGQVGKCHSNQLPINVWDVACRHMTSCLPEWFGDRFHNRIVQQWSFVGWVYWVFYHGKISTRICLQSIGGRDSSRCDSDSSNKHLPCYTYIYICLCPLVEGSVEVSIILMPLNPLPVYCDRQS
jgi:hypothetical protein